ncbi:uncharacterized protein BDR25DRAFT_308808 [Lindgomyces ingoldianus]|uniref:Uncharacterized protein n=1 Tax=Lindgomyces ingoldianus TaxID=673940 RepID=A0ACB6RGW9_9PLEO|nr:uncharacterized protein BDR25DRAFT_308808 [Lindgomyces ingoldianus]KAF2477970.1 hypothetical protein BDR25DRAFT_308808 [Lindgomyces ingoldianus]
MAYGIMGSMPDSRMLTYRTMKDVKAVYFDGASANLIGDGTTSQMVLLYNGSDSIPRRGGWRSPPNHGRRLQDEGSDGKERERGDDPPRRPPGHWNPLEDEYFRARGLCKWLVSRGLGGIGWGYEGIVRMNAGFEVIWCDFDSPSLKLLSNLNVSAPRLEDSTPIDTERVRIFEQLQIQAKLRVKGDEGPHGPGMTDPTEPFRDSANWFWFSAAAKRYFGDARIKVNPCGVFSFYEPELLNQSRTRIEDETIRLNLTGDGRWNGPEGESPRQTGLEKLTRRRREHSLDSVGNTDGLFMRQASERRLKNALKGDEGCSGVDWHYLTKSIVVGYAREIQKLLQALNSDFQSQSREWLQQIRALTHWFMMPFLEYPPGRPYDSATLETMFDVGSPLALATLERCQSQHDVDKYELGEGDNAAYYAVKETLAGICGTVIEIGLGVEHQWLLNFNSIHSEDKIQRRANLLGDLPTAVQSWKAKVEDLMAWLGWVEKWTSCDDSCGADEVCYVPMWPVSGFPRRGRRPPNHPGDMHSLGALYWGWGDTSKYFWEPVCVNASSYPPENWE